MRGCVPAASFETHRLRDAPQDEVLQTIVVRSAATPRVSNHEARWLIMTWRMPLIEQADTDSSEAVRLMASAISGAIGRVRMLGVLRTAAVGWIESVITSSFSLEEAIRAAAPPDSTPWLI